MTTIHFGVKDEPYSHTENVGKVKKGKNRGKNYASTTGDVAEILEENYHVMEVFFETHQDEIMGHLEEALEGAFDTLLDPQGKTDIRPFEAGEQEIKKLFQNFIDLKEMDRLGIKGVPTHASIIGINSRKEKLDPGRPSFKDSGLYEANFECWVEK